MNAEEHIDLFRAVFDSEAGRAVLGWLLRECCLIDEVPPERYGDPALTALHNLGIRILRQVGILAPGSENVMDIVNALIRIRHVPPEMPVPDLGLVFQGGRSDKKN